MTHYTPSRSASLPPQEPWKVVVAPRSLADYRAMYALTERDITTARVLDCAAGVSSFGAEARAMGGDVTSVDIIYALSAEQMEIRARKDLGHVLDHAETNAGTATFSTELSAVVDAFLADYTASAERYVTGRLPELPFADDSFDFALCGDLLFSHPDLLDEQAAVEALAELLRVAADIRIFPVLDTTEARDPLLASVVELLRDNGIVATTCEVSQGWQVGAGKMLRCTGGGPVS